jgi:hypothetical protein
MTIIIKQEGCPIESDNVLQHKTVTDPAQALMHFCAAVFHSGLTGKLKFVEKTKD